MSDFWNFYSKDLFSSPLLYDLLENFGAVFLCFLLKTFCLTFQHTIQIYLPSNWSHLLVSFTRPLLQCECSPGLNTQPAQVSHNSPYSYFMISPAPSPTKSLFKWHPNLHFQSTELLEPNKMHIGYLFLNIKYSIIL